MANGDIYVPVTTAKTDAYRTELLGGFGGLLLARSPADFPAIKAELETRVRAAPLPGPQWKTLIAPAESFFEFVAGNLFGGRNEERSHPERLWAVLVAGMLLFSLLPAVNLVNLNMSRIMERASEIGVRKAFGASSRTLVGQFIVENLVLTLIGGAAGLVLSALALARAERERPDPVRAVHDELPRVPLRPRPRGVLRPALRRLPGVAHVAAAPGAGAEGGVAMIRHLLRLVWNRKRSNLLVALEILLSFIVLTAVTTLAVFYVDNYRKPLGFDVDRHLDDHDRDERGGPLVRRSVSRTARRRPRPPDAETRARQERLARIGQLLLAIRDMPEVEAVAGAAITPYSGNTWKSDIEVGGRRYRYGASAGTDDFARAMGLTVTRGRWFTQGRRWRRVAAGGDQRAPGEGDVPGQGPGRPVRVGAVARRRARRRRMRIVGVIREFRKDGEFAAPENFLFSRVRLDDAAARWSRSGKS